MESGFMQMVVADTMKKKAIHHNFVYAQDADQSYQPGQAAIHVPMYPQQQFNYLHHHCHPQLSLSFESIEWVPGGGNRFSYSFDVILTVCLGEHGNMRSATYIHLYVDGDGKSLLMCTKDRQTFPPIETPAIPPPAMPATPQLVNQKISSTGRILHSTRRVQFL
ncbi:unnamed protein product [Sphagnum jensenii]|uniref:Uncharacterized protein n=1 Tax=Sphagnum jensenii TaxID=128206 RepID=A0ABP1AC85_9BRYO